MDDHVVGLGGTLRLNTPVDEIIVENGRAVLGAESIPGAFRDKGRPFQPPCREIHTTASANRTASTSKVMIPRAVIIKKTSLSKEFQPQYTPSAPGEQPESAADSNFFRKTKIFDFFLL